MKKITCVRTQVNQGQIERCKKDIEQRTSSLQFFSETMNLAGNMVRLKILYLLFHEKQLCVCDISDILEMNISAVSQHLRKLKDKKMILPRREGQTIYYSLSEKHKVIFDYVFSMIENENL